MTSTIGHSTLDRILSKQDEIINSNIHTSRKRFKVGKYEDLENHLYNWIVTMREKSKLLSSFLIIEKASIIAKEIGINDFNGSRGWFNNFRIRYSLKNSKLHGEAGSADFKCIYEWLKTFSEIISKYQPENILNLDETALFYQQLIQRTYITKNEKDIKGFKQSKKRVTVLVTASMTGEKFPLHIIGKFKKPRCFKGIHELPVEYHSQSNGWMSSSIFYQILKDLNFRFCREKRKVLILLDQCPSHPKSIDNLDNIELLFLPKNTTSVVQPMDLGIIHSLKANYRKILCKHMLFEEDEAVQFKYTILDCLNTLKWT